MSRGEVAEAVNEYIRVTTGRAGALRREEVWRWESGLVRWPGSLYREALRAVLGVESDEDLGFVQSSRSRSARPAHVAEPIEADGSGAHRAQPAVGPEGYRGELTVQALVRHADQVLVIRDATAGSLFLPGGQVRDGMPVQASLQRYVAGQTGLEIAIVGFAGGGVEQDTTGADSTLHAITLVFEAHLADDRASPGRTTDRQVQWVEVEDLARHDVQPIALRDALLERADGPFWRFWTR